MTASYDRRGQPVRVIAGADGVTRAFDIHTARLVAEYDAPLSSQIETRRMERAKRRREWQAFALVLIAYGAACLCLGYLLAHV